MIDVGYATAVLGGILSLLSPCSAVLLPAFFAYAFSSRASLLGRTALFYLGLLTTLLPIGVAAGSLGALVNAHRGIMTAVLSVLVISFGLVQLLGVTLPSLGGSGRLRPNPTGAVSVYLLGATYGLAGFCSGPIVGAVLAAAAMGADPVYGGVLLALYALGMVVPLVVLAVVWDRFRLTERRWLRPHPVRIGPLRTTIQALVSGGLLVAVGLLMLFTDGTADLGGILTADQQVTAEAGVSRVGAGISDLGLALGIGVVVIGAVLLTSRRRPSSMQVQATDDRSSG